ncbi:MAG TPA: amidohydrolase family protein, partial [Gemmatimonadaceae bacterium]|nr:amidohydrolase family protein [Gemmatimonadaceae bacterium]
MTIAIVNGAVWTGDEAKPWAQAVALSDDRIVAVGSTSEIRRRVSPQTRVIDAQNRMVVPGFIDSHVHFLAGGLNLASVQLRDVKTPADFIARIKAFAATIPSGTWITGGDWD